MSDMFKGIVIFITAFLMGLGLGLSKSKEQYDCPTRPVEESIIDTLYLTKDSIIYNTIILDSIKYDTIEKVYNLNDSATLQLFLQLVSE